MSNILLLFFIYNIININKVTTFNLTIIHTNDVHAHYEKMDTYGGQCRDNNCFGGMARLKSKVEEIRSLYPNTLFLDGGDQYQGTLWFTHYGGTIVHTYMNLLGYDVMTLGNHEFDRGPTGLVPLLDNAINFTVVSCNIDTSREPSIQNKFSKHTIMHVDGEKIGIIGYTTKDTPVISSSRDLIFLDEIESIRAEVTILKNQGVNKIIALGHAGYRVDKKIAEEIADIDIVVGGHSNTFLYTGTQPSSEVPVNVYPTVVKQNNGDEVLVIQDYTFAKYLGFLQVQFDNNGKITRYSGNPILLDNSVPEDESIMNVTKEFGKQISALMNDVIGRSLVKLEGNRYVCRLRECNMGNLITDGMVYQNLLHADNIEGTQVFIALLNSGSIRASIERGNVTFGNAIETQPFRNTLDTIKLRGDYLLQALEHSVEFYDTEDPSGAFLQFSGIRVSYDLSKPALQRVVEAYVICQNCTIPEFELIDKSTMYSIIISNFMLTGGDGYNMIKDHAEKTQTIGSLDSDVFVEYIRNFSPLYKGVEGRIRFVTSTNTNTAIRSVMSAPLLFYLLFVMYIND